MEYCVNPLERLWLTEAIRLREEHTGPLEDTEANRQARQSGGDLAARLEHRALSLARRDGLVSALEHWQQGARLAVMALALFALVSGAGLAFAALGDGSLPVNVFWAVGSLLGLNWIMLTAWGLSLMARNTNGALGRIWWWLSGKFARDANAVHLAPALVILLQRRGLNRWLLGSLVNGLWCLALLSALVLTLLLLATRRYGFVWETTILSTDTFVSATQALGALPGWLGFHMPAAEIIRISDDAQVMQEGARQAWASWLVGVLVVYGILPRLLLGLFCLVRWRQGRDRLRLDLAHPGYTALRERLMPSSERLGVNDPAPDWPQPAACASAVLPSDGAVVVGLELDQATGWPPSLPAEVHQAGILDDRASRRRLLEQLAERPAARLLVVCDPNRSPDRGTLALLAELARSANETRIWLMSEGPVDADRLGDWHAALETLGLKFSAQAPMSWLETGHE